MRSGFLAKKAVPAPAFAGLSPLRGIATARNCVRKRESSWDRTGGNADYVSIHPGKARVLADLKGPGCIAHLWMTLAGKETGYLQKMVLRVYWDGETAPSVEVPVGDFFGAGFAPRNFSSLPIQMSPREGRGFNCFFPMPFARGARIEVASECAEHPTTLYYYVDWEKYGSLPEDQLYFHAQWRCERPAKGTPLRPGKFGAWNYTGGKNLDGKKNYVLLDAKGRGHYVGAFLYIENKLATTEANWYGEGDDMIFIDGERFPPSLHGTGTEDYFDQAWSPDETYSSPYHGLLAEGKWNWAGKHTWYRFHIEDPVVFHESIRMTIEHGHDNHRSDHWASTAFWYQREPHKKFPQMTPVEARTKN